MMKEMIRKKIELHTEEAKALFYTEHIVGIFLHGSQNYQIDLPGSDIDTKVLVTPTFEEIALNKAIQSGTHVLSNKEHLDYKDIRLYFDTIRKQNINFIEILFTKYSNINLFYNSAWEELREHREAIARYNPWRALWAMRGMIDRNRKLIFHPTANTMHYFDILGYNPKALAHCIRLIDFMGRYMDGEDYEKCLIPTGPEDLKRIKQGQIPRDDLSLYLSFADWQYDSLKEKMDTYFKDEYDKDVEELLIESQKRFMKISLQMDELD